MNVNVFASRSALAAIAWKKSPGIKLVLRRLEERDAMTDVGRHRKPPSVARLFHTFTDNLAKLNRCESRESRVNHQ